MAKVRMAVLVHSGKRVEEEFSLKWKDQVIQVWVEEISGQWIPDFLKSPDSEWSSPGNESEDGKSSEFGSEDRNGCMGGSFCMGNSNVVSPSSETHVQNREADEFQSPRHSRGMDEREVVGPELEQIIYDSPVRDLNTTPLRPSYVTIRKNRRRPTSQAQSNAIPDLNVGVEGGGEGPRGGCG
ncbi:hypothetical protein Hanom_Chr06g00576391 [Helianthus anomalus]